MPELRSTEHRLPQGPGQNGLSGNLSERLEWSGCPKLPPKKCNQSCPAFQESKTVVFARPLTYATALLAAFLYPVSSETAAKDDAAQLRHFENKIRPILVEHCYSCHSVEAKANGKLQASLYLDSREGMLAGGDNGPTLSVVSPEDSILLSALRHEDFEMPPTGKLPPGVIEDFARWIRDGAFDPRTGGKPLTKPTIDFEAAKDFWAFQPPRLHHPPKNRDADWACNEIDQFIKHELELAHLNPAKPASPRRLLRRATFDLTGLPPTIDEISEFLESVEQIGLRDAYAQLIDRLLSSHHYGEKWGRHWLDVARYAEDQAHTFGVSRRPHAHEYRDWVIRAFNSDMPYDQFVKRQLAGDLMEPEEMHPRDRLAGLGILGLGAIYYKNSDKAQAQADELDDRIDTVTRGLLGLTVSCARCHDHKYDPIPTQDYYSLAGVFHNTRMVDKPLASQDVVDNYRAAEKVVKDNERLAKDFRNERKAQVAEAMRLDVHRYMLGVWHYRQQKTNDAATKIETTAKDLGLERNWLDRWNKFLDSNNNYLKNVPALDAWLSLPQPTAGTSVDIQRVKKAVDVFENHLNYCLDERDGKLPAEATKAIYTSKRVDASNPLVPIDVELKDATHLYLVICDAGDGSNSDWGDWLNPRLSGINKEKSLLDLDWVRATTEHHSVRKNLNCSGGQLRVAGVVHKVGIGAHSTSIIEYELPKGYSRFTAQGGLDGSGQGSVEFRVYTTPPTDIKSKKETPEQRARKELIKRVFSASGLFTLNDKELESHLNADQLSELNLLDNQVLEAKNKLPPALSMAHVVQDTGDRNLKTYLRGDPNRQGEEAPRRFLKVLSHGEQVSYSNGSGRLELANDIASPDNPLTARVIVNRVWQHHFGRGLVATPSNFGALGDRPSHPELLDTLSVNFMEAGWSLKWLHRQIMLSATYQQSSTYDEQNFDSDPENRLLWRMNRRRLEVEAWRDALLAVSGNLDVTTGGPTENLSDMKNNRRTVYGAISRHDLNGLLRLFDFPDANVTSATRTTTTVPQQQLFVLNSDFFVRQAKNLAGRLQTEAGGDLESKIAYAYQLLFSREPDEQEVELAQVFLQQPNEGNAKLSRLEQYAQALLASNEFLYID